MPIENFPVGTRVKSFDFPGVRDDCYVEGTVVGVDADQYAIVVDVVVQQGFVNRESRLIGEAVYPPVNGRQSLFGGVTNGVVRA